MNKSINFADKISRVKVPIPQNEIQTERAGIKPNTKEILRRAR